jgi:hypothetical protein
MPEAVTELENEIDRTAGTERWVTGDAETIPFLRDEHFDFRSEEAAEMLAFSVERANAQMIRAFMDAGTMDNQLAKDTALRSAAFANDPRLVEDILKRGANPNAQDDGGRTALMLVESRPTSLLHLIEGDEKGAEIIAILAASGANPNLPDNGGNAPLHLVARKTDIPPLIRAGAELERRNATGETPILKANDPNIVLALIGAGANIDARDSYGHGLLEKARDSSWNGVSAKIEAKHSAH